MNMKTTKSHFSLVLENEELTGKIIGAAIKVHKTLGPGFIESIYQNAFLVELRKQGLKVEKELSVPIFYDGVEVGKHRVDLLVKGTVVVELKVVQEFEDIHFTMVKSYFKATGKSCGLLMNFAKPTLDIKRIFRNS